jgi:simple sugar transport system ATP-binding protein
MSEGRIVFETPAQGADRRTIGAHMGGAEHGAMPTAVPTPMPLLSEAA